VELIQNGLQAREVLHGHSSKRAGYPAQAQWLLQQLEVASLEIANRMNNGGTAAINGLVMQPICAGFMV
jgi:hypothetical protein